MQTIRNLTKNSSINIANVSIPESFIPKKFSYSVNDSIDFMSFIASQHPLINVWLVFSFVSISILSVLLYVI